MISASSLPGWARCQATTRDTFPPPGWTRHIRGAFAADPSLDAITGHGDFYDVPRWRAVVHGRLYLWAYYASMHGALAHPPLWGSTMALPRDRWEAARERVHRWDPEVHDDVDLALALPATAHVRHDRTLRVQVSGRSLVGWAQTRRRFRRGMRTVRLARAEGRSPRALAAVPRGAACAWRRSVKACAASSQVDTARSPSG